MSPAPVRTTRPAGRPVVWPLALLAGSWLVSWLAHAVGVDWLLLVLLLVGTASVLRVGRGLLDRLVIATLVLAGMLMTGGILFSLWPWGLEPPAIAGVMFTVLIAGAWLGRRTPRLPFRFDLSDLPIVGTGLFAFWAVVHPLRRVSGSGTFLYNSINEDRYVHFAIFETIHRLGFPFFSQDPARISLPTPTEAVYPSGSHYLYTVLDIFFRSTTDGGATIAEYNRFFLFTLAGYAFMAFAIVWGARWVAQSAARGWRLLLLTSVVAALMIAGHLTPVVLGGFDSEVLALAFVALTVAVAVRPPRLIGERIVVLGSCLVLVAYTYYLFLPFAGLAVLASLWTDRKQVLPAWRPVLVGAVVTGAASVIPLWFMATSKLDPTAQAVAGGARVHPDNALIIGMTVALLLLLLLPWARRSRTAGRLFGQLGAGVGVAGVFGAYQLFAIGTTSYYFDKLLTCLFVVCTVCFGVLVTVLPPLPSSLTRTTWARLRQPVLGLGAGFVAITMIGGIEWGFMSKNLLGETWGQTMQGKWYHGGFVSHRGEALRKLADQGLLGDDVPTLFLCKNSGEENWRISLINSSLNKNMGTLIPSITRLMELPVGEKPVGEAVLTKAVGVVLETVESSKVPLRFVVRDAVTADAITEALSDRPDLKAKATVLTRSC